VPVSQKIRERLQKARHRFHANDCIAPYIEPDELALLQGEVEEKLLGVLQSLVIDVESDHNTRETARRVAQDVLMEVFRGRYTEMPPITEFPNVEHLNELMIVGPSRAQRLLAPPVPDPRQGLDRRAAQRALEPDRALQVRCAWPTGS